MDEWYLFYIIGFNDFSLGVICCIASGSSADLWYKIEAINGVTPSDDSGASTTLDGAVNPGATSITVAADTIN